MWRTEEVRAGFDLWQTIRRLAQIWAVFMLPLLITLETALLNGIEHSDNHWKHLFALAIPRSAVYFAKWFVAQALILISTASLVLIALVGTIAKYIRPELAGAGPVPSRSSPKTPCHMAGRMINDLNSHLDAVCAGQVFRFHSALAWAERSSHFSLRVRTFGKYYPWLLLMNIFIDGRFAAAIILGVGGGIVAAVLGCYEFVRRDVG